MAADVACFVPDQPPRTKSVLRSTNRTPVSRAHGCPAQIYTQVRLAYSCAYLRRRIVAAAPNPARINNAMLVGSGAITTTGAGRAISIPRNAVFRPDVPRTVTADAAPVSVTVKNFVALPPAPSNVVPNRTACPEPLIMPVRPWTPAGPGVVAVVVN